MSKAAVKLFIRVRCADGRQLRVAPVLARNNALRPHWALVEGKEEHHPESSYVLRYRDPDGRRRWLAVGSDPDAALAAKIRKEKELELSRLAAELGARLPASPEAAGALRHVLLADAFAQYLSEIKGSKAPKTWSGRKRVTEYFKQSCHKRYIEDVGRRDLLEFRAFLFSKGLKDRSVFNAFQAILTVFRALGITRLVQQNDWPSYTERAVRAYSESELQKLFAACDPEEELLFRTFLFSGCREQEVQFLAYNDVQVESRTIAVRAKEDLGFRIKDREERLVPVPEILVAALEARRKARPSDRFIFPAKNGCPMAIFCGSSSGWR